MNLADLDHIAVVLVAPSHPGNVGATARAMKVMGLSDLRIVQPRFADVTQQADARAFASGAGAVLDAARLFDSLDAAIADAQWSVAMAMQPREYGGPVLAPREAAALAGQHLRSGAAQCVAFVFGPERTGLSNDAVLQCRALCQIPSSPAYGSLNLAQAVQVMSYELYLAAQGPVIAPQTCDDPLASHASITGMLAHLEQSLIAIDFLNPAAPKRLMPRLASLFGRTQLTVKEVDILRGIARQMEKIARNDAED
jgi:tRNA/rRNA methyltransferase